jgi:hypothetical protein
MNTGLQGGRPHIEVLWAGRIPASNARLRRLRAVEAAAKTLAEYRDDVDLQQVLALRDWTECP